MDHLDPFDAASRRAVAALTAALPELAPILDDLAAEFGDEPPAQLVFSELAGVVRRLLGGELDGEDEALLEKIFAAVEEVAVRTDVESVENVGYAFLDGLGPNVIGRASAYFGPATDELVQLIMEDDPGGPV